MWNLVLDEGKTQIEAAHLVFVVWMSGQSRESIARITLPMLHSSTTLQGSEGDTIQFVPEHGSGQIPHTWCRRSSFSTSLED